MCGGGLYMFQSMMEKVAEYLLIYIFDRKSIEYMKTYEPLNASDAV